MSREIPTTGDGPPPEANNPAKRGCLMACGSSAIFSILILASVLFFVLYTCTR